VSTKNASWEDHVIKAVKGKIGRTVGGLNASELVGLRPWYNQALAILDSIENEKLKTQLDLDLKAIKWAYITMDRGEPVGDARFNQPTKQPDVPRGTIGLFSDQEEKEKERGITADPAPIKEETTATETNVPEATAPVAKVNDGLLAPIWNSQWFAEQLTAVRTRFEKAESLFEFQESLDRAHVVAKAAEAAARMGAAHRCVSEAQGELYRGAAYLHEFFKKARSNGELKQGKGRPRKGALEKTMGELGIERDDLEREALVGKFIDKYGLDRFQETLMESIKTGTLNGKVFAVEEKNSRSPGNSDTSSKQKDIFADQFFALAKLVRENPTYYASGQYAIGQNEHNWAEVMMGGSREMMRSFAQKLLQLLGD